MPNDLSLAAISLLPPIEAEAIESRLRTKSSGYVETVRLSVP